jgi:hypothetical protein
MPPKLPEKPSGKGPGAMRGPKPTPPMRVKKEDPLLAQMTRDMTGVATQLPARQKEDTRRDKDPNANGRNNIAGENKGMLLTHWCLIPPQNVAENQFTVCVLVVFLVLCTCAC